MPLIIRNRPMCERCDGTGIIMHYPITKTRPYPIECPDCGGEGDIEVEDMEYSDE